ncbi:MAG: FHA domain-containing protein [Chloroflexota bacterium]
MATQYAVRTLKYCLALFVAVCWAGSVVAWQGDGQRVRITAVNAATFPDITVRLLTRDGEGRPFSDPNGLSLQENGVAVGEFVPTQTAVGVDVTFVIDANPTLDEVDDDSGLTRQTKVEASISHFAADFMRADGLDVVSVVVPEVGGVNGRFHIEADSDPNSVRQAMGRFEPGTLSETPLGAMLELAIRGAKERENGRFQAILLFTDGASLGQQLDFPALLTQAADADISIYAAILGARADANEVANVEQLTLPTHAFHIHMPQPADADPIYAVWQAQQQQWLVAYRSLLRQSGGVMVAVAWNGATATATEQIELTAPRLSLSLPNRVIARVGEAPDTPLAELRPGSVVLPLQLVWPNGVARPLAEAQLFVNGQPAATGDIAADGAVQFVWDLQAVSAGQYQLVAVVTDELEVQATSEPLLVEVRLERPLSLQTPAATAAAVEPEVPLPGVSLGQALLALAGIALLGLLLFFLRWWGTRPRRAIMAEVEPVVDEKGVGSGEEETAVKPTFPTLVCTDAAVSLGTVTLLADNITFGRDPEHAQIVLSDRSVSRLHARIRQSGGGYWLYDEGSANGTLRNFERLGLAPQPLGNGDEVQMGRIKMRFYWQLPESGGNVD